MRASSRWTWIAILLAIWPASVRAAPPRPNRPADPRGWQNPRALELAREAVEAKKANDPETCVQKDQASLALEDHPYVKLHLALCLQAIGKLTDALARAKDALGTALRSGDEELQRSSQARVTDLLPRIAHVRLLLPADATGTRVTFDNIPVRASLLKQRVAVDPGDHVIEAERTVNGERQTFKERITLPEGAERAIEIVMKPRALDQGTLDCLEHARTYEEKLACIERKTSRPSVHVGLDLSGYADSTHVNVFSPSINASVFSPTEGWNVGASYLVDVVSAASPDIVSMASPAYHEQRHAVAAGGGYKVGTMGLSASADVSSEPDYLSTTGGAAASTELADKSITPRLGYAFTYDRIGIRNTPFSQFERNLATHHLDAGITFVLSPTTLLVTGLTAQAERGEESKLYRYVPLFPPEVAARVSPGESVLSVNENRLTARARELLPRARDRFSAGARVNHRFGNGTLRVEERVYLDTWGVTASTTDAKYFHDLGDRLRVWPHLRLHGQSGASFYRLAYPALVDHDSVPLALYTYRTGDRELSPMLGITAGGGVRIALTSAEAAVRYAVVLSGEVMYNRYLRSLYIRARTSVYGSVGFEVEL